MQTKPNLKIVENSRSSPSASTAKTNTAKTGVLLINLGTPEATDFKSVRRYLKQFLSDKRVVENSGPIWWLILNGIILRKRPKTSGKAYDLIWNRKRMNHR